MKHNKNNLKEIPPAWYESFNFWLDELTGLPALDANDIGHHRENVAGPDQDQEPKAGPR